MEVFLPQGLQRHLTICISEQGPQCSEKHACVSYQALVLLVDVGVVFPLAGKSKHATDNSGIFHGPMLVADLLPGPFVFHLHITLCDRHPLAVGGKDGTDPDVLYLDVHVLEAQKRHW